MRIDLVFPILPPRLDGIGDHTAHLAQALARRGHDVRVLTGHEQTGDLGGVDVVGAYDLNPIWKITDLVEAVRRTPPDWLFLQFNQFSYGPLGFNPFLPWTLYRLQEHLPQTRIAMMAHEEFVPANNVRNAVMATWQRTQFWALGRIADVIGYSTSAWMEKFRPWFPTTPACHLPVGSNLPVSSLARDEARAKFKLRAPFVIGYFGSVSGSRYLDHIRSSLQKLDRDASERIELLYIGRYGSVLRDALPGLPVRDLGALPAPDAADAFAAMDLYLAPFVAGVSTRRGSFMAALQHCVPTVATAGTQTDPILRRNDGNAFVLRPETDVDGFAEAASALQRDPETRKQLGRFAHRLYRDEFDWPVLARRVEEVLRRNSPPFTALYHHYEGTDCLSLLRDFRRHGGFYFYANRCAL
jgi:glycosyltransferase involved in cell wall biosynthesis